MFSSLLSQNFIHSIRIYFGDHSLLLLNKRVTRTKSSNFIKFKVTVVYTSYTCPVAIMLYSKFIEFLSSSNLKFWWYNDNDDDEARVFIHKKNLERYYILKQLIT